MLRIVKSQGKILIDRTSKADGRGAYICDNPECIKKLKKGRILNRVFSCAVEDGIYAAIEEEYFGTKQD